MVKRAHLLGKSLKAADNGRGFRMILAEKYQNDPGEFTRLLQESSAISEDADEMCQSPGSSFLWVGQDHHLSRKQVVKLVKILKHWLLLGRLPT